MPSRTLSRPMEKLEPLTADSAPASAPMLRPASARKYSSGSMFFFCGIIDDVPAMLSGKLIAPNS